MKKTLTTKQEIVAKRKSLYMEAARYHEFMKGDKRVNTPRLCVICGRPLSSLIMNENRYVTIVPHIHFHLNKLFKVDICKDIMSCYRTLKKKGELD